MSCWRARCFCLQCTSTPNLTVADNATPAGSQLADRVAALEAEKASWQGSKPALALSEKPPASKVTSTADAASSDANTVQIKLELAEALRSKGQLQSRLKVAEGELQKLRSKTKVDNKRISDLTIERNTLMAKLKDRNEELVGKNKMLKVLLPGAQSWRRIMTKLTR